MAVMIYRSKYSPNFPAEPTGRDAPFRIGDRAKYKSVRGDSELFVRIDSELMSHDGAASEAARGGPAKDDKVYEVVFEDGSGRHAVSIDRLYHLDLTRKEGDE